MEEYELVKFGSLLHDIGKVVQRDVGKVEGNHSELGYEFLRHLNEDIALFAKFHHIKEIEKQKKVFDDITTDKKNLLWMVYEADNLSSAERGENLGKFNPNHRLKSVFSKIRIDQDGLTETEYPLTRLDFNNFVYPVEKGILDDKTIHKKNYSDIYSDFKKNFPYPYLDLIMSFLEKETTFIPSRTGENDDISLFDHLKTTCAIASCMYLYYKDKDLLGKDLDIEKEIKDRNDEKYLLISGDISGIQKFIYNITSKGALKLLRARSFYLEMVSEDLVQELLDELNLTRANLLYCAGGHFYILAPNTKECKDKTNYLKKRVNQWLFEKFNGILYYAISYIEFNGNMFETKDKDRDKKDFSDLWVEIGTKISEQKSKKFREILVDNPEKFLREDVADKKYKEKNECKACKTFVHQDKIINDEESGVTYCDLCYKLKDVGGRLSDCKYIIRLKDSYVFDADLLDLPFSKIKIIKSIKDIEKVKFDTIFQINSFDTPLDVIYLKNSNNFTLVPLPLGNYFAKDDSGRVKSLDQLSKDAKGINKIGILRMDVDHLGMIFREGLPTKLRTISRITNLSRFLNYFFKGYLNLVGLFEERNIRDTCDTSVFRLKNRDNRNFTIIYSGGDDLLLAGSWDDVLEAAFDINALFRQYTGYNPNITISAGFGIFDAKFPFYKMAEITGKKLDLAKNEGRNRIWIFDRGVEDQEIFKESISWNKFLETWADFKDLLDNTRISKRSITRLMLINRDYKNNIDKVSWCINLAYWYGQLEEDDKKYFSRIIGKYSTIKIIKTSKEKVPEEELSEVYFIDIPLRILDLASREDRK